MYQRMLEVHPHTVAARYRLIVILIAVPAVGRGRVMEGPTPWDLSNRELFNIDYCTVYAAAVDRASDPLERADG